MFSCCSKAKPGDNGHLSCGELTFISYAALIRGAIAFGLVANIKDSFGVDKKEVVVSSVLILVIATTIIFGTFTSTMQRCLLKKP